MNLGPSSSLGTREPAKEWWSSSVSSWAGKIVAVGGICDFGILGVSAWEGLAPTVGKC
jgi:hypothetical protein